MSYEEDRRFEKQAQARVVIPQFYKKVWGEDVIIESDLQHNELAKLLDFAGIDKIIKTQDGIIGLSQRIQREQYAKYKSITIRKMRYSKGGHSESEYYKTIKSMQARGLTSAYQSHIYVTADVSNIIWGIIVDKFKLYDWMNRYSEKVKHNRVVEKDRMQTFCYVVYRDLPEDIILAICEKGVVHLNKQTYLW